MNNIFFEGQVMWSMIDINGHLRHSAYADFAAQARVNVLSANGLTAELYKHKIGPVLFREELIYKKEIRMGEYVKVSVALKKCRADGSRYSLQSIVYKADGTISAIINVDGDWLDLQQRKIAKLPTSIENAFLRMPKTEDFTIEPLPEK